MIYIYIYVCVCVLHSDEKKNDKICLTNFRILLILSHSCESIYIKCAVSLATDQFRAVADAFRPLRTHQRYKTSK